MTTMVAETRHLIEVSRIVAAMMKFGVSVIGLKALFLLCVTLPTGAVGIVGVNNRWLLP